MWGRKNGASRVKKFALLAPVDGRGANLAHLNKLPLEVMHKVLASIQKYPRASNDWWIKKLLKAKAQIERGDDSDEDNLDEDETMDGEEDDVEGDDGVPQDYPTSIERHAEYQAKMDERRNKQDQIKSLGLLMSVVRGVVVPLMFS